MRQICSLRRKEHYLVFPNRFVLGFYFKRHFISAPIGIVGNHGRIADLSACDNFGVGREGRRVVALVNRKSTVSELAGEFLFDEFMFVAAC